MVVTWLHKAREAEERRRVAEEQPLVPGGCASDTGDADSSGEENDDPDEVVYDIQVRSRNVSPGRLSPFSLL